MKYRSTRGDIRTKNFDEAMMTGLAPDGGLFVPNYWPQMSADTVADMSRQPYFTNAAKLIGPFIGSGIAGADLTAILARAYASFRHRAVTPLTQIAPGEWVLELYHGPTLAFKDVALQLLALLMERLLKKEQKRITILVATSGDTGAAAIDAFSGIELIDIVVLHPYERISEVQRKQMTTNAAPNIHNLALRGSFDDCQTIVKALFADNAFRERFALSGANSINWARIAAQTVYYFVAGAALGAPYRRCAFSVPTGNFGNVYAGYVAKQMGLPMSRLVVATNSNDLLARAFNDGEYAPKEVVPTQSPSMDIQISSNFERLLFDLGGVDAVTAGMDSLKESGKFTLSEEVRRGIDQHFVAERVGETPTTQTIRQIHADTGKVIDPHTAVGIAAARAAKERGVLSDAANIVCLSTAHPGKFPDALRAAIGHNLELPDWVAGITEGEERFTILPAKIGAVADYMGSHLPHA